MAGFFKIPASAGVVVRAEHLFSLRLRPESHSGRLTCRWTHDADGRLFLDWEAGPGLDAADRPRAASSAA